jgi:hypothetical protein
VEWLPSEAMSAHAVREGGFDIRIGMDRGPEEARVASFRRMFLMCGVLILIAIMLPTVWLLGGLSLTFRPYSGGYAQDGGR